MYHLLKSPMLAQPVTFTMWMNWGDTTQCPLLFNWKWIVDNDYILLDTLLTSKKQAITKKKNR